LNRNHTVVDLIDNGKSGSVYGWQDVGPDLAIFSAHVHAKYKCRSKVMYVLHAWGPPLFLWRYDPPMSLVTFHLYTRS
jgi:hypothetical protein